MALCSESTGRDDTVKVDADTLHRYCMFGTSEFQVLATATGTEALPTAYADCHAHGSDELYVLNGHALRTFILMTDFCSGGA
jgi:hypothetical protein